MAKAEYRQPKTFTLAPKTIWAIQDKARELNLNDSRALDVIVQEWINAIDNGLELPLLNNTDLLEVKRTSEQLRGSADRLALILLHDVPCKP